MEPPREVDSLKSTTGECHTSTSSDLSGSLTYQLIFSRLFSIDGRGRLAASGRNVSFSVPFLLEHELANGLQELIGSENRHPLIIMGRTWNIPCDQGYKTPEHENSRRATRHTDLADPYMDWK